MYQFIKAWVLPPAPLLLAALVGFLLARRRGDGGWWLAAIAVAALVALSTPLVADRLLGALETCPPLSESAIRSSGAQAIVVLSAEDAPGPEYDGETVGELTLVRLRYAARLQAETGLPLLVSGGPLGDHPGALAVVMKAVLENEFHVPVAWAEEQSKDTAGNARYSAAILKTAGIGRILLVTHAWHMPRSRDAFERAGLAVVPTPTAFTDRQRSWTALVPTADALTESRFAVYETLGRLWYALADRS